jgi:16S rRNA (guanine527-N7)-methyltransferase
VGTHPIDTERLVELAGPMGVHIDLAQAEAMAAHAQAVVTRNETVNLTRVTDADDVLRLHLLDSLSLVPLLQDVDSPLADVGSGAGFPGIPVAIATGMTVVLVESRRKKAAFLREAVESLGIEIRVLACRAEEVAAEIASSSPSDEDDSRLAPFGAVLARAVAPLPVLVELAAPLLRPTGRLLAMKGDPEAEEVRRGEQAAALVGLSLSEVVGVSIPGTDAARRVLIFQKVGESGLNLPRRPGMAQKRPLA